MYVHFQTDGQSEHKFISIFYQFIILIVLLIICLQKEIRLNIKPVQMLKSVII